MPGKVNAQRYESRHLIVDFIDDFRLNNMKMRLRTKIMRIFYTVTFSIYNYMGKFYPTPDRKLFQNPGNAVQKARQIRHIFCSVTI